MQSFKCRTQNHRSTGRKQITQTNSFIILEWPSIISMTRNLGVKNKKKKIHLVALNTHAIFCMTKTKPKPNQTKGVQKEMVNWEMTFATHGN